MNDTNLISLFGKAFMIKKYLKDADLYDFERQVAAGESQPCKAFVDNGGETSPEIVSQNTF